MTMRPFTLKSILAAILILGAALAVRAQHLELMSADCVVANAAPYFQTDQIDLLVSQLKDPNPDIRLRAADGLGKLKDPKAVEPLIVALNDSKSNVADISARALGQIKDPRAVEPLIIALRDPRWDVRSEATKALGELKDGRAVEPLIAALHDTYVGVRLYAIESLNVFKDPRSVEPLLAALGDSAPVIRYQAVAALGQLHDARAVEPLIAILNSSARDPGLRDDAATALGELKDPRAVEPLIAILKEQGDGNYAIAPLGMIGSFAVEPLLSLLKDPEPDLRIRAAEALVRIDDPRVAVVLLKALHDRDLSVIAAANSFYLKRLSPELVDTLIEAFNQFGPKTGMGENLLNSGNSKLEQVVEEWARVNHRQIATDKSGHRYFVSWD
jgi:HEAT repeat protein